MIGGDTKGEGKIIYLLHYPAETSPKKPPQITHTLVHTDLGQEDASRFQQTHFVQMRSCTVRVDYCRIESFTQPDHLIAEKSQRRQGLLSRGESEILSRE